MTTGADRVIALLKTVVAQARAEPEDATAVGSGVAIDRFVSDITSELELRGELESLGYTGQRRDRLVVQARLQRDTAARKRLAATNVPTSIGLVVEGLPAHELETARQVPTSIGLVVEGLSAAELETARHTPTSIGLVITVG